MENQIEISKLEIQQAKIEHADDLDLAVSVLSQILCHNLTDSGKDMVTTLIAFYNLKSERIRSQFSPAQRMEEIKELLNGKEFQNA